MFKRFCFWIVFHEPQRRCFHTIIKNRMCHTDLYNRKISDDQLWANHYTNDPSITVRKNSAQNFDRFHKKFNQLSSNKLYRSDSSSTSDALTYSIHEPSTQLFMKFNLKTFRFLRQWCSGYHYIYRNLPASVLFIEYEDGYTSGLQRRSYYISYYERCGAKLSWLAVGSFFS